ncbi:MAG: Maf family protein, partial [Muribaculaceae bacterium]|nr:Maf family protein [Muribaculaceae bacterium]
HHVATGVTISTKEKRTSFTTVSEVTFAELTEEEINYYVENYIPLDKAGAYGIQEWIGAVAVSSIKGSFYNVMGLPVHRLYQELKLF